MKIELRRNTEYSGLKRKLLGRFAFAAGISFVIISVIYTLAWRGRIANLVVWFMQTVFHMEYLGAISWYEPYIGNYTDVLFLAAVLITFFVLLKVVLNWFAGYFFQINDGIAQLLSDVENITLPNEMLETEYKLNAVKAELKRRDLERKAEENRKNELVMYLAHDIRTPLTSVIGYLNLLNEKEGISEQKKSEYAQIALEKAYHLEKMVEEFFEITRMNARQIRMKEESVDVSYLLVQLVDEMTPLLASRGNTAELAIPEDLQVTGDPDKLARAFGNILKNAASYGDPGEAIRIEANKERGTAQISFINKGNTLSSVELSAMFEKFFRLDAARSSKTGGTGLGLAIAKEIIELHGGSVCAKSQNHEVEVIVQLPLLTSITGNGG